MKKFPRKPTTPAPYRHYVTKLNVHHLVNYGENTTVCGTPLLPEGALFNADADVKRLTAFCKQCPLCFSTQTYIPED